MNSKRKGNLNLPSIGYIFISVMLCLCANLFAYDNKKLLQEIKQPVIIEIEESKIDEIALKQTEMRDVTILIKTRKGGGSGTIIDRLETGTKEIFEYRVLTNAHVTNLRFVTFLSRVNSLTGKIETRIIDVGCDIIVFNHVDKNWNKYDAKIIAEDIKYDFAILSFLSNQKLNIAKIACKNMIEQVRVFDEIFAIGCQLGQMPTPTTGIISQILTNNYGEKEWVIYGNTAQITPGSSGGGLFKKYDDHYYLIGIPFRLAVTENGQIIPHLSHAISIATARDFIEQNSETYP